MGKAAKSRRTEQRQEQRDPRGIVANAQAQDEWEHRQAPKARSFHIQAKTERQQEMIDAIKESSITTANGPAGCGKTYISGSMAAKFLAEGEVSKIVLTRANVHVGKTLGMLPGSLEDKMEPLLAPILAVLREKMGEGLYSYNRAKKKIDIQALEYIRGMSFKDTFLIIDESQNLTVDEVQALITRYESGRILFIGDPFQTDIKGEENGLVWLEKFSRRHGLNYPIINYSLDDIVRSDLVKQFLIALYSEVQQKQSSSKKRSALTS